MYHYRVFLTDAIIVKNAKRIQHYNNSTLSACQRKRLTSSNGCLGKFKLRKGFRMVRSIGENREANRDAIASALPILRALLSVFTMSDILIPTSSDFTIGNHQQQQLFLAVYRE